MTRFLGSWPGIAAVVGFCGLWLLLGFRVDVLTMALSVFALSLSQMILIDTAQLTARQDEKLDAIIHGTDADDAVADR